jgi:hypothetical protein
MNASCWLFWKILRSGESREGFLPQVKSMMKKTAADDWFLCTIASVLWNCSISGAKVKLL